MEECLRRAFDEVQVIFFKEAWGGVPRVVLVPMSDYGPHERSFWIKYLVPLDFSEHEALELEAGKRCAQGRKQWEAAGICPRIGSEAAG